MLQGLTWDHPRGYLPLDAIAASFADPAVRWERQSLDGFESAPIADLARRYDLLVIDHPGVADAVEAEALYPLDELLGADELAAICAASVGESGTSYAFRGRTWAVPIDAAAQVCAYRADLLSGMVPGTWSEIVALSTDIPVGLCLGGPHALLALLALIAAQGVRPWPFSDAAVDAALSAWPILLTLTANAPDPTLLLADPIQVLEAMSTSDRVALCPLVYGYVTYAGDRARPLMFADAPRWSVGSPIIGSVLGGTGLAVSATCSALDDVRRYLRLITSDEAQEQLIPQGGGQPASRAAWRRGSAFFSRTRETVEQAWVRPRRPGWVAAQAAASEAIRSGLLGEQAANVVVGTVHSIMRSVA